MIDFKYFSLSQKRAAFQQKWYAQVSMHVHIARLCFVSNGHECSHQKMYIHFMEVTDMTLFCSNDNGRAELTAGMQEQQVQGCFHK